MNTIRLNITDLAKKRSERPAKTIENWMHSRSTLGFLKVWEQINNPNFKVLQEQDFKGREQVEREFINNSFSMYPSKWMKYTNAKGLSYCEKSLKIKQIQSFFFALQSIWSF